jgi:hypothetical protein
MTQLFRLAGLIAAAFTLAAAPALAAPGGGGSGAGGGTGTGGAWVSVSPNPAAAWGTQVDITGCGYGFATAEVVVTHPAGTTSFYVPMWSTGCMDNAYFRTSEPGTYSIAVYQLSGSKRTSTMAFKASTALTVT